MESPSQSIGSAIAPAHSKPIRIAAIGDIHCTERSFSQMKHLFSGVHERAEVLILCGDITDNGRTTEMEVFLAALKPALQKGVVVLSVLGNHDFHSGKERQLVQLMQEAGVRVFFGDDNLFVYNDQVGFVGVKGFWGGFNPNVISAFGEEEGKAVMRETAEDVRRMAKGLRSLNTPLKVAIMHYSPIKDTLKGESPELYGVLGAEWLARPLDEEGATVCFHGHSHRGSYNGLTRKGIPVYNVSAPVLRRAGLQLPSIHLV